MRSDVITLSTADWLNQLTVGEIYNLLWYDNVLLLSLGWEVRWNTIRLILWILWKKDLLIFTVGTNVLVVHSSVILSHYLFLVRLLGFIKCWTFEILIHISCLNHTFQTPKWLCWTESHFQPCLPILAMFFFSKFARSNKTLPDMSFILHISESLVLVIMYVI